MESGGGSEFCGTSSRVFIADMGEIKLLYSHVSIHVKDQTKNVNIDCRFIPFCEIIQTE